MFEAYYVVREGRNGSVRHAKIRTREKDGLTRHVCNVDLWSHSSCALNTLHHFVEYGDPVDGKALIKWLKTQPFYDVHGWNAQLFTLVPMNGGVWENFCKEFCEPIHSFKNLAHGGNTLTLYMLDLTKHANL